MREGRRKSEDELLQILEVARIDHEEYDPPRSMLTEQDCHDMMGMASRMYRSLEEPQEFFREGPTPSYGRFRAQTSTLNVAKILLLKKKHYGLHTIWATCMEGRQAGDINKMLGGELKGLIEAADEGLCITRHEAVRMRGRHALGNEVKLRQCKYFRSGYCRTSVDCEFLHMKLENELGPRDEVFTDF